MIQLPRTSPNLLALLDDTQALVHNAEVYLNSDPPHTPAGLALALGFSSFAQLKTVMVTRLQTIADNPNTPGPSSNSPSNSPPDPSSDSHTHRNPHHLLYNPPVWFHIIYTAFSMIEDDYLRGALTEDYRPQTVQHILNAYFDVIARSKSENSTNIIATSNQTIQIVIPEDSPSVNQPEIERLSKALPDNRTTVEQLHETDDILSEIL